MDEIQTIGDEGELGTAIAAQSNASERLGMIAAVTGAVVGTQNLEQSLVEAASVVRKAFNVEACVIRIVDGDNLRLMASIGEFETALPELISIHQGIAHEILTQRKPLTIESAASHSSTASLHAASPPTLRFESYAGAPMLANDELLGVLGVYTRGEKRSFSQTDLDHLQIVSNHLGVAILSEHLYHQVRDQKHQLEREVEERQRVEVKLRRELERMAALRAMEAAISSSFDQRVILDVVLEQLVLMLKVDAAAIILLDNFTQQMTTVASRGFRSRQMSRSSMFLGQGAAGQVALSRVPLHLPDCREAPLQGRPCPELDEGFVGYYALPLIARGQVEGVLELYQGTRLDPDPEWIEMLEGLAGHAAVAIDNASLVAELHRTNSELVVAYDRTLEGWSHALDLRDHETEGHSRRVTEGTMNLARLMGVNGEALIHLRRGALLHDIGKLGIPDSILLKPGRLTNEEWEIMKRHPVYARRMLEPVEFLRPALDIPHFHHEKWDGTGYPLGLAGNDIPLHARIFAVIDVWDALTSDRPYRSAWPHKQAYEEICSLSGQHFDPNVIEAFRVMHAGLQPGLGTP